MLSSLALLAVYSPTPKSSANANGRYSATRSVLHAVRSNSLIPGWWLENYGCCCCVWLCGCGCGCGCGEEGIRAAGVGPEGRGRGIRRM